MYFSDRFRLFCFLLKILDGRLKLANKRKTPRMKYEKPCGKLNRWRAFTLTASSANMEQCSLTGGSFKCDAISVLRMDKASSMVLPLTISVAKELGRSGRTIMAVKESKAREQIKSRNAKEKKKLRHHTLKRWPSHNQRF